MGRTCYVKGCKSQHPRDAINFYVLPKINKRHQIQLQTLTLKRRAEWLKAINRGDLDSINLNNVCVCSKHFINGRAAKLSETANPDWIPSVNLCITSNVERVPLLSMENTENPILVKKPMHSKVETFIVEHRKEEQTEMVVEDPPLHQSVGCQTEEFYFTEYCSDQETKLRLELEKKIEKLQTENQLLKLNNFSYESLRNNNKKTNYCTGCFDFRLLETIYEHVENFLPHTRNDKILKCDILVMTLIKIRLDLPFTFLSYMYSVSIDTIIALYNKSILALHAVLSPCISWPDKECVIKNMPMIFRKTFGPNQIIIIDCFEVYCEKPGNLLARANLFSNYKHHHTLKYLIAIDAVGNIAFISQSYAGRCSDKFIFTDCGILDLIKEDDIVLCDRGFLVEECVTAKKARLITPSFKNGRSQMEALEIEKNREISSIRIHVERVIGVLRQKYLMLSHKQPITAISKKYDDQMTCDYIMKISCGIFNLSPRIFQ